MAAVQVFNYNESPITFNHGDKMVNATEMAKPFGKQPKDWMVNKSTQAFLTELSSVRGIPLSQLISTKKGNSSEYTQGTWMHEDVALEFARWLSPAFGIWCNDRIKELMTIGITAMPQTIDSILANPENAIKMLTALQIERQEKEKALAINEEQQKQIVQLEGANAELQTSIEQNRTRVDFANHFITNEGALSVRETWKKLRAMGINVIRLSGKVVRLGDNFKQWLRDNKYIFPFKEEVYTQYLNTGIFINDTIEKNGYMFQQIKVTSKGLAYFFKVLNSEQERINAQREEPSLVLTC